MRDEENAHFLFAGSGPLEEELQAIFASRGLAQRLHMPGAVLGEARRDMYNAMDTFVFASTSETQGLVLSEAMAGGVPVIALDANGSREMVRNGKNGLLVTDVNLDGFIDAIRWHYQLPRNSVKPSIARP